MSRIPVQSPADESWRIFIAIELPASLRQSIKKHGEDLRLAVPSARASWAREENVHLTLKFLGDTPVTKVESLSQAAQRTGKQTSPFPLTVGGCGVFPLHGQPRVLWVGIQDPSGDLKRLYQTLEDECARLGFTREERSPHPHLTVARLRQPHDARRLAGLHQQIGFGPFSLTVGDVCLIRSELGSGGSRYTVISRHELAGGSA